MAISNSSRILNKSYSIIRQKVDDCQKTMHGFSFCRCISAREDTTYITTLDDHCNDDDADDDDDYDKSDDNVCQVVIVSMVLHNLLALHDWSYITTLHLYLFNGCFMYLVTMILPVFEHMLLFQKISYLAHDFWNTFSPLNSLLQ